MEWLPIARDLGLPSTIAMMLMLSLWRGAGWIARNILLPWRDRHFEFLGRIESAVKGQTASLESLQKQHAAQSSTIEAIWVSLHKGDAA